jgi:hypothetical protein
VARRDPARYAYIDVVVVVQIAAEPGAAADPDLSAFGASTMARPTVRKPS